MTENVYVYCLRGVRINGVLLKRGHVREITEIEAKPLLARGTVKIADDQEVKNFFKGDKKKPVKKAETTTAESVESTAESVVDNADEDQKIEGVEDGNV